MSATFDVQNPATGRRVRSVANAGTAEARVMATKAIEAFPAWRDTTAYARSAILRQWFNLMLQDEDRLAELMTVEMGKPISESRGEVKYAAAFVEWYAEEAKRVYGETVPSQSAHKRLLVTRQPVGPVYADHAVELPGGDGHAEGRAGAGRGLHRGAEAGRAIAAHRPPARRAVARRGRSARRLPGAHDRSIPLPSRACSSTTPAIRKLTFTGSTEVGMLLAAQAARTVKRVSLELGGHAPFLVFDDADLDAAVREVVGVEVPQRRPDLRVRQPHLRPGRHPRRIRRPAHRGGEVLRVGDPMDAGTHIGPLVDQQGHDKVAAHVAGRARQRARARWSAATRAAASSSIRPCSSGWRPACASCRKRRSARSRRSCVSRDDAEAVSAANGTPFGLAAYLWTRDLTRAFRVSEALDFGIVGVNDGVPSTPQAPFGGVKASGLGREGGKWGIEEFLDLKYVSIALG